MKKELSIIIIIGFILFFIVATGFFRYFVQVDRIIEKTIDADNVIYNYEWFERQNEAIKSIDKKIRNAQNQVESFESSLGERKDWDREDKIEHSRLSSIVLGLKQQRNDIASEFNARSKMRNREIFKSRNLPERIELDE